MSVVDPRSFAFQSELVFALQSMLSSSRITGEVVPSVILIQFGEGKGAPRFRSMSSTDWEASRTEARNGSWTPAARVNADGHVFLLM